MVRATRRGSSIMGSWPTPASTLNVAWGRRSGSALAYSAIGSSASSSDHATVIGHGNGFSGAICQSSAERSLSTVRRVCRQLSRELGRGQSIPMDGSVAECESAQSCRSVHQREGGSQKAANVWFFRNDLKARACKPSPEDHRPGGDRAHTVAARPRRANSIAMKAPKERPARCGRSSPRSSR
jgi:hypothetical protein